LLIVFISLNASGPFGDNPVAQSACRQSVRWRGCPRHDQARRIQVVFLPGPARLKRFIRLDGGESWWRPSPRSCKVDMPTFLRPVCSAPKKLSFLDNAHLPVSEHSPGGQVARSPTASTRRHHASPTPPSLLHPPRGHCRPNASRELRGRDRLGRLSQPHRRHALDSFHSFHSPLPRPQIQARRLQQRQQGT